MKKPGIRIELSKLWRKNITEIMGIMHFTQGDVAVKMGRTRQSIANMLNRDDFHLSAIQFLGTLRGIHEMITESDADERNKKLAYEYWNEINDDYLDKGLH